MINVFNKKQLQKESNVGRKKRSNEINDFDIDDTSESKKEKKKHKKEKRKHREEVEDVQEDIPVVVETEVAEDDAEDDEEAARRERKRLKKEAKRQKKMLAEHAVDVEDDKDTQEVRVLKAMKDSSSISNDYILHPDVAAMTMDDVSAFRAETQISLLPEEEGLRYKPLSSFAFLEPSLVSYSNLKEITKYIATKKFLKPSPIQSQCWPPLLEGRDVIGIAQTGSGKTLAFLVPGLLKISKQLKMGAKKSGSGGIPNPKLLVLAPTRELAMQSHQVAVDVNVFKSICIFGGMPKQDQKKGLRDEAEVVIATPGRLIDLIEENSLTLADTKYLVLDEADRMLDDGFEPAIRKILAHSPAARQTVMFSATWPESIRKLAETFLKPDCVRVIVGSDELSANHRVKQIVECIEPAQKDSKLVKLLEQYHKSRTNRVIIFVLYKMEASRVQKTLQDRGFHVTSIHGDKSQSDRIAALEEFKSGRIPLLIATDVAARGLDIPQVEYVLNYSFPLTVEDYVHRIGRTGRGGATGISHTFFTDNDKGLAGGLVNVLQEAGQDVPKEIYKYPMITKKTIDKTYGAFGPKKDLVGLKATKKTFDDDE